MGTYQTIVVGTDGSDTSFRAVDGAAGLAGDCDATRLIACAYSPQDSKSLAQEQDILGADASYQVVGSAPADTLQQVVREDSADLLVAGNRGLNTPAGRILGSVPLDVGRHTPVDALIVHTT